MSGTALLTVNGKDGRSGEVDVDGIDVNTTTLSAVFHFRARGLVYQDTQTHSGSMTITSPTLHIEYTSVSTPDGDVPETEVIITRPEFNGVQLPRLLDENFREIARLHPIKVKLSTKLNPLSTAEMHLPPDDANVKVRDFVELFTPHGSAGIFRATELQTSYGSRNGQLVYLEHAFCTLSDSLALGAQAMSAPVATVIATLLNSQNIRHWVLGACEVDDDFELIYEYSYDNLLQSLSKIVDMLPTEYAWEFDMSQHPFVMHLRKMPEDDACECRLNRNLSTVEITIDSSNLCTRVIPFGAGEGTDRVTLTNLIGSQHMDSENASVWGYVSRTFTSGDIFDALTLRDVAQKYLDNRDTPTISVRLDAIDLFEATGEPLDRFHLGRICRLPLPDYGIIMRERVIEMTWPDVYSDPEDVEVLLANRIRNASDEIAELLREATNSKLLGGSVETVEENSSAGHITPGSPFVQTFQVSGYGNLLNVKIAYTCITSRGESVDCSIMVDDVAVEVSEDSGRTVDITRYLAHDDNHIPLVGEHKVRLQPKTANDVYSVVDNTVTIKQINKR